MKGGLVADADAFAADALVQFVEAMAHSAQASCAIAIGDTDSPLNAKGFCRDGPLGNRLWTQDACPEDGRHYDLPLAVDVAFPRRHAVANRNFPRIGDPKP